MRNEILLALFRKMLAKEMDSLPVPPRGPRGERGPSGVYGQDGKDFVWEDNADKIKSLVESAALKFEDLTADEISLLRGPRGHDGHDGKSFVFDTYKVEISSLISERVAQMSDELKLKFEDLTSDDVSALRGPKGRDGRDGKGFVFDEHLEFFQSLKPKFKDFSDEERESLVLKFSALTDEERSSLKLKFEDLTGDEISLLRGSRGQRGRIGPKGESGERGELGPRGLQGVRGLPGISGATGRVGPSGGDGADGQDGQDAPFVTDIRVKQTDDLVSFVFEFSDDTEIETNAATLPPSRIVAIGGGGSGGSGGAAGPAGATGPQGIPGIPGDGDSGVLHPFNCAASVYPGAAVYVVKENAVEATMDEWLNLSGVLVISYLSYYDIVARNARADALATSNVIGLVESKSTSTTCLVRIGGVSAANYLGLDIEDEYFLSDVTPGGIVPSALKPVSIGRVSLRLGQSLDQFRMIFERGERMEIV